MSKNNRNTIYQVRPASGRYERWKDATPLGNGCVGALVFGDVGKERIRFTRGDVWTDDNDMNVPDVKHTLSLTRSLMDNKEYRKANDCLYKALCENGYCPTLASPFPICDLTFDIFSNKDAFSGYKRALHLDSALCEISYNSGSAKVVRKSFISRIDGLFYMQIESSVKSDGVLTITLPKTDNNRNDTFSLESDNDYLVFKRPYRKNFCGAKAKIQSTDGKVSIYDNFINIEGFTSICFTVDVFSKIKKNIKTKKFEPFNSAFERNKRSYSRLYNKCDIKISNGNSKSNELLLLEAFNSGASNELLEKLWRFGRYLFISGTAKKALPFALYGLWVGDYNCEWTQHVANENVQIIYWHSLGGSLCELMLPLIDYYYKKIPEFRENAKNLFGCRGIVVSVYTTPFNSHIAPPVPVILNYTMASGWLCRNFFDYYDFSHDEKTLKEKIIPFALETAQFIEDFSVIKNGELVWYPSVSPENSPLEFSNTNDVAMGHSMPTTKNATMEIAIIKDTLTRLIDLCTEFGISEEKIPVWQNIVSCIPEYKINKDGAIREWQTQEFTDNYCHRHLSHIYPVFPGNEITKQENPFLFSAFEKAVDLRELCGQSGWSLAHMAGIYARLGRGKDVFSCLDVLCRSVLLDNFFTIHNDYRENHTTLVYDNPPMQLDALLGEVNALQQILCDYTSKHINLLSALPERLTKGSAKGLCFPGGKVDIIWDTHKKTFKAKIFANRNINITINYPCFENNTVKSTFIKLNSGEKITLS